MKPSAPGFHGELKWLFQSVCLSLASLAIAGSACAQQAPPGTPATDGLIQVLSAASNDARTRADQFLENALSANSPDGETGLQATSWLNSIKPSTRKSIAVGVLAVSLSLLALFLLRQSSPRRRGVLPEDVVSLLGQVPFGPNQKLQLVRLGSKLLLVTTTPAGSHTLGEISDPEEVLQIETLCRSGRYDAIGATLRSRIRPDSQGRAHRESARNRAVFEA